MGVAEMVGAERGIGPEGASARAGTLRDDRRPVIVVGLAAAAVEALLGFLAVRGTMAPSLLLIAHLAVIVSLASFVWWMASEGRDTSFAQVALIATATIGPLGALGSVAVAAMKDTADEALLAQWYRRITDATDIDDVTRLCDNVSIGRTLDLSAAPPRSLAAVMQSGTLGERQAALGLIARSYRPGYVGALQLALRSPEPVIRAQAAAVAARLRSDMKAFLRAEQASPQSKIPEGERAALLEAHAASGLLDDVDNARALRLAQSLRAQAAQAGVAHSDILSLARAAADRASIEKQLLADGRFGALRALRRVWPLVRGGRFVVRRRRARKGATARAAA